MDGFNNFYFGPHKAFPYPYKNAHQAHLAYSAKCGTTFLGVFLFAFILQRIITRLPNMGQRPAIFQPRPKA